MKCSLNLLNPFWYFSPNLTLLLRFGLGNWADIAEHVGTKNRPECEFHYWNTYFDNKDLLGQQLIDDTEVNCADYVKDERGQLVNKSTRKPFPKKKKVQIGQDVGYMPYRGDFDIEFENNAEDLVAFMQLPRNEHEADYNLCVKVIEAFEFKLQEREKRKKFVIERELLDYKRIQLLEKKKSKEERDLYSKLKPFARFCSQDEFNNVLQGFQTEKQLIEQIKLYQSYRALGIQSKAQAEKFELEKKRRESDYHRDRYRSKRSSVAGSSSSSTIFDFDLPMEIGDMSGVEYLSDKEKDLCSTLRLPPKQYMVIKDAFIRQSVQSGLSKSTAIKILSGNTLVASRVYDFFKTAGWI